MMIDCIPAPGPSICTKRTLLVGPVAGLTSGFLQVTKHRSNKNPADASFECILTNPVGSKFSLNPYHQILSAVCFTKAPIAFPDLSRSFHFNQHHVTMSLRHISHPHPARCHGSAGSCPPPSPGRFAVAQHLAVQVDAFALRLRRGEWRHGQANRGPKRGLRETPVDFLVTGGDRMQDDID